MVKGKRKSDDLVVDIIDATNITGHLLFNSITGNSLGFMVVAAKSAKVVCELNPTVDIETLVDY
jgi:hypothetical protein